MFKSARYHEIQRKYIFCLHYIDKYTFKLCCADCFIIKKNNLNAIYLNYKKPH